MKSSKFFFFYYYRFALSFHCMAEFSNIFTCIIYIRGVKYKTIVVSIENFALCHKYLAFCHENFAFFHEKNIEFCL